MEKIEEITGQVVEVICELMRIYGLAYQTEYDDKWDYIAEELKINLKAKLEGLEKIVGKLERCWNKYYLALYVCRDKSSSTLRVVLEMLVEALLRNAYEKVNPK